MAEDSAMRSRSPKSGARQARAASPSPGRAERRRLETRARLIRAARDLMARNGVGATSIQEITDTADVGFGSFYNHFASKEEIAGAVMDDAIESFGTAADRLSHVLDDPAEVLAASVRHAVRKAAADQAWGWFLVRTALVRAGGMRRGLGARLARDIAIGLKAGRFAVDDAVFATAAAGGTVLAVIAACLHGEMRGDAPERAAATILRMLGLSSGESREIAHRELPDIDEAKGGRSAI